MAIGAHSIHRGRGVYIPPPPFLRQLRSPLNSLLPRPSPCRAVGHAENPSSIPTPYPNTLLPSIIINSTASRALGCSVPRRPLSSIGATPLDTTPFSTYSAKMAFRITSRPSTYAAHRAIARSRTPLRCKPITKARGNMPMSFAVATAAETSSPCWHWANTSAVP